MPPSVPRATVSGSNITLRAIRPDDGLKIAALGEQTPDTGAVALRNLWLVDPYAGLRALHDQAIGVVAETPEHEGIVGLGMMCTGTCHFEGALRPYAYLFSLSVHPAFRRRGIASQLAMWRVQQAQAMLGEDAVIFAGIQQGNEGSLRNAAKWSTQRIDGRTAVGLAKMRGTAPTPQRDLVVRPAEKEEFAAIAAGQNAFYGGYNFYPPRDAETLYAWHRAAPFGVPLREYFVVVDRQGNIVGGLSATQEGLVTTEHVTHMAPPLRVVNFLARILPADGVMRRIQVKDMWFAPGRMDAAHTLWESVRWLWRERGTMLMAFVDPQSPLAQVMKLPWYMPRQNGSLVCKAPLPIDAEKCLYLHM